MKSGSDGFVIQVSVSHGGLPKSAVASAMATRLGLEGDAHAHPKFHGGPRQALLLVTLEGIGELRASGFPLYPGALGENLTTEGIDRRLLAAGSRLCAGEAVVEITKVRAPCKALDVYGAALLAAVYDSRVKKGESGAPKWGLSGFYASVIEEGRIRAGDRITIVRPRRFDEPID